MTTLELGFQQISHTNFSRGALMAIEHTKRLNVTQRNGILKLNSINEQNVEM